jgi:hypothetical protein
MYVWAAFEAKSPPTCQDLVILIPNSSLEFTARGVSFDWYGFCSILNFAQLARWTNQNKTKSAPVKGDDASGCNTFSIFHG